jgi:hypothetical protein
MACLPAADRALQGQRGKRRDPALARASSPKVGNRTGRGFAAFGTTRQREKAPQQRRTDHGAATNMPVASEPGVKTC